MKITLISTGHKNDKGPKIVANFLDSNNHQTQTLYYNYLNEALVKEKVENSELIVVSANLESCKKASEIFKILKPLDKPLVYAGIYPQDNPDECIKDIDLVIVKNPKETILELANRLENFRKISDIPNLWFKATEKDLVKN